ncbi:coiled-coil domain-containing protein-domain-containing protein [Mucor lusitanicus]|uniref:Coiled-coil domain-containing protein-domain-containing protein n=1 Tax=Mucor circinelloides f. lusitanicus TaxID=29924 RepID=A0A8H4BL52_MUCCL|nr:coiled-coil domain-containing protein-domain-containing protein [Mucor lusitanicus]
MEFVTRNIDTIPFKTLRHGEVELPQAEQLIQIQATLHKDPALFLSKWGRYLSQNSLRLFQGIQGNYEVDFYLDSLLYQQERDYPSSQQPQQGASQTHKKSAMQLLAQNRRYKYLQQELRDSDYYSDESIQLREPVLYDQFIGQYIPARERAKPFDNDMTLVNRIFSNMDRKFVDDHLHEQKIKDEEQFEEEEEEDEEEEEEEEEDDMEKSTPVVVTKKKNKEDVEMKEATLSNENEEEDEDSQDDEDSQKAADEDEDIEADLGFREEQRAELIRLLEEKFLAGKDEFDYDQVDYNEDYDDLQQLEQDIHDRYFDEDE